MRLLTPLVLLALLSACSDDGPPSPTCAADTCKNGGSCTPPAGACVCTPPGVWTGPTCEIPIGAEVTGINAGTVVAGLPTAVTATILDPGALATSVDWTFGDGTSTTDTALRRSGTTARSIVSHTYAGVGSFTVSARAHIGQAISSPVSSTVTVAAPLGSCDKTSWTVTTPGFNYAFDGTPLNPVVLVCAGRTYTFHLQGVDADHPFCIRKAGTLEDAPGVVNNCVTGTVDVVWTIPADASGTADYRCMIHLFGSSFIIK